jgi:hypothetical protein
MSRARHAKRTYRLPTLLALVVVALGFAGCGIGDFEPRLLINSVRIIASRADKPYAKPGETVNIELLAFDGRPEKTRPMRISWIPVPCINPKGDSYFDCFRTLLSATSGGAPSGGGDAGAEAGADGGGAGGIPPEALALLKPGVDITPYLPSGPTYSLTLPSDIITSHPEVKGAEAPYGLAILFNIACAGHVELIAIDPNDDNPQVVPIGCFDENGKQLPPSDYVLGFTRVYAYDSLTNQNPVIDGVTFDGAPVDPAVGITVDRCTTSAKADCPKWKLDTLVPESSQEVRPRKSGDGKEQVAVQFSTTRGDFSDGSRLLYDSLRGKLSDTTVDYQASQDSGQGTIFLVVKDNRGGATWLQLPLNVR